MKHSTLGMELLGVRASNDAISSSRIGGGVDFDDRRRRWQCVEPPASSPIHLMTDGRYDADWCLDSRLVRQLWNDLMTVTWKKLCSHPINTSDDIIVQQLPRYVVVLVLGELEIERR